MADQLTLILQTLDGIQNALEDLPRKPSPCPQKPDLYVVLTTQKDRSQYLLCTLSASTPHSMKPGERDKKMGLRGCPIADYKLKASTICSLYRNGSCRI